MPNLFASCLSTRPQLLAAVDETVSSIRAQLDQPATAAVVFATHDYASEWEQLGELICDKLETEYVIGCSAEGVIGTRREVEEGPAMSLWATAVPVDRQLTPFSLELQKTHEGTALVGWPESMLDEWPSDASLLMFADPFSFPSDYLLERVNDDHRGVKVVGGMASGASSPGDNRLFLGRTTIKQGVVIWMLQGSLSVSSIVSQGCRPIGEPFVVTAAERNIIFELGGKPALQQLQRVFLELPNHEQSLFQRGVHLGRVVSEYQDQFQMGDFLIRNVLTIDRDNDAIAVGDYLRPGQTVQFHLRDEQSASLELKQLLAADPTSAAAALLFSCNGRGTRLFSDPHQDATLIADKLGDVPLAGFFAQGEIGPVGGANFVHGFTASLALFRES